MYIRVFFVCILLIHLFQIIYFNQAFFKTQYNQIYWKDRWEHAQWVLPLSKRIIGDDGIYAYAGYRLLQGDSIDTTNANKPPVGLYLIGLSIVLLKNPAYYALFFGIGSIVVFYFISSRLLKNTTAALVCSTLFFLDPLIFTQFWKPWLEIAQLFFLLLHFLLFLYIISEKPRTIYSALLVGLILGFFIETKPAILFPIIFILETAFIFYKNKKMKIHYILYIAGIAIGVIIPYIQYFYVGHSFIDFLKLHKYMSTIYTHSQNETHYSAVWKILFLGNFPDVVNGAYTKVSEWWFFWPVITVVSIASSLFALLKKETDLIWKGLAIFLLTTYIIFTFTPIYTRYLVLVLPFLYLFFVRTCIRFNGRMVSLFCCGVILYAVIQANMLLQPSDKVVIQDFYYNFSNQFFQDIYEEDIIREKPVVDINTFRFVAQKSLQQAEIKNILITEKSRQVSGNTGSIIFDVLYKTQNLGSFTERKTALLVKEDQQWKIRWDWDLVLHGFKPGYSIKTIIIPGKRGSLSYSNGDVIAKDTDGYIIYVNPEKIDTDREQEMLQFISLLTYQKAVHLQNAYLENTLPGTKVALGTTFVPISEKIRGKLSSYKGVSFNTYPSRINIIDNPQNIENTFYSECCTRIYSSYNYHGVSGLEQKYDTILSGYDGGSLLLLNQKDELVKIIIEKKSKHGEDIVVK